MLRRSVSRKSGTGTAHLELTSAFVEQLHALGRDREQVTDIGVARKNLRGGSRFISLGLYTSIASLVHFGTHSIDMVRKTPPLILVDRMLRISPFRPLHRDLALDGLHISSSPLFQQRMQLHPIFQLDFARSVNIGPLESFSGGIVCGRVGRGEVLEDGGLVQATLVINVDLAIDK
jgi:hypothetical protein